MKEDVGAVVNVNRVRLDASHIISALIEECSAITDYHILHESLPRRLSHLLGCRAVLFYQKVEETLQFVAGSYDDKQGWSAALLSVVHINPIRLDSDTLEARTFMTRHTGCVPRTSPTMLAVPLIYRQRIVGVMVAIRGKKAESDMSSIWHDDEVHVVECVGATAALLLENVRLLERNREHSREFTFLNSLSSQLNSTLYEKEYIRSSIIQHVREVTGVDLCDVLEPVTQREATDTTLWLSSTACKYLFEHFQAQQVPALLFIECANASVSLQAFVAELPYDIKTFFAFPLLGPLESKKSMIQRSGKGSRTGEHRLLGVVVGAYYHPARLQRDEVALLQAIGSHAGIALEHMCLVADVKEARHEARKLLRRVLADQKLKELIFESIPSGLITVDMKGRITSFNRAASSILGYTPKEVIGYSLHSLLTTAKGYGGRQGLKMHTFSTSSSFPAASLRTLTDTRQHGTFVTQDKQGQEVVLEVDVLPLRDERAHRVGAVVTLTDMTSVHRLEEEKRHLDRLALLGEMAANVAHEVRNPLASIKVSIQMLMDDLLEGAEEDEAQKISSALMKPHDTKHEGVQESTAVVLKEVERLDAIVRELLLFARPRQLHRSLCALPQLCEHVLHLLHSQCVEARVVVHSFYDDVPLALVDVHQIEQVLFNLFTNAIQAMPEGGNLTVSCRTSMGGMRQSDHEMHEKDTELQKPQWLEVQIADTGVGIPEDHLERIFQPFFTTKAHGIGLGLSITKRLLEDHGGSLWVESGVGRGTTIVLRLPFYDESQVVEDEYKEIYKQMERGSV